MPKNVFLPIFDTVW